MKNMSWPWKGSTTSTTRFTAIPTLTWSSSDRAWVLGKSHTVFCHVWLIVSCAFGQPEKNTNFCRFLPCSNLCYIFLRLHRHLNITIYSKLAPDSVQTHAFAAKCKVLKILIHVLSLWSSCFDSFRVTSDRYSKWRMIIFVGISYCISSRMSLKKILFFHTDVWRSRYLCSEISKW